MQMFISKDPIEFESGDFNHYRYVENDPVNYVDPSGLDKGYKILAPNNATMNSYHKISEEIRKVNKMSMKEFNKFVKYGCHAFTNKADFNKAKAKILNELSTRLVQESIILTLGNSKPAKKIWDAIVGTFSKIDTKTIHITYDCYEDANTCTVAAITAE